MRSESYSHRSSSVVHLYKFDHASLSWRNLSIVIISSSDNAQIRRVMKQRIPSDPNWENRLNENITEAENYVEVSYKISYFHLTLEGFSLAKYSQASGTRRTLTIFSCLAELNIPFGE